MNFISAISILLLLAGSAILIIGLIRHFFPSTEQLVPDDLKKVMTIRTAAYLLIAALVLINLVKF